MKFLKKRVKNRSIKLQNKDSSSEERPSEIKERFHRSSSETGLETKRSTMHSEVQSKMPELQSAENRINLCDVKKKNL